MNKELAIERIFSSVLSSKDFEPAVEAIEKLIDGSDDIFEILWQRAIKPQSVGKHVLISAISLYRLNINCPLSLQRALEQVCIEWEISIGEVAWYLANQFSREAVLDLTNRSEFKTEEKNIRLETIDYWIKNMG